MKEFEHFDLQGLKLNIAEFIQKLEGLQPDGATVVINIPKKRWMEFLSAFWEFLNDSKIPPAATCFASPQFKQFIFRGGADHALEFVPWDIDDKIFTGYFEVVNFTGVEHLRKNL